MSIRISKRRAAEIRINRRIQMGSANTCKLTATERLVMKLGNKWYKATERLLYTYKSFPIRIKALTQQLEIIRQELEPTMIAGYELREGKQYSVSSPVERAAIERIEGDAIQKIEQKIKNLETMQEIVEDSIGTMLDHDQRQLVEMIYWQQKTWQVICMELMIEKNCYYNQKNDIVKVLAWCFGYLPDDEAEKALGIFMDQALWQRARVG